MAMKKLCALAIVLPAAILAAAQGPIQAPIEWRVWSGDQAHTRYSTISDITPANVQQLQRSWEWATGEMPQPEYGTRPGPFEATPVMIGDVLYLSTPYK